MDKQTRLDTEQKIDRLLPRMIADRRHLHRHPELSFQEKETAGWIAARLAELGCSHIRTGVGGHGIIAEINGMEPGPVVVLRADIDALPIQEEKESEYRSAVPGVMHACGHDAHTSALLGIAAYYESLQGKFKGTRRLLFQPAEELTPGGALPMIQDGALDGADAVYGVHLWTPVPAGQIKVRGGAFMAGVDEFTIDIIGKGGHGGMPQDTADAIVAGSALVQALQTVVSRNVSPLDTAVLTIGSFQAGEASNIIAGHCRLKGTVRTFDPRVRERVKSRIAELVRSVCAGYGTEGRLDYRGGYPPVINNATEAERCRAAAIELFGADAVSESELITAGEDFAYYLERVPGCFLFVGAGNEELDAVYPHHHPKFDLDESSMRQSALLLIGCAERFAADWTA
ncbi:amidohydrolase [Paenibacillus pasadenensis]|uniref:amidohydrolase n=1 Tax=Paenibacillus pasadenensis TaxID=217090 RepID=UPI00203BA055|nr:amidohydrolase [Paenibacillus pasadenensis]MCM3746168.1 amidohydrolase [Paenibacillus pasadenensis]